MAVVDVTATVKWGEIDGELLPLSRCICGAKWDAWSGPILSIYSEDPYECPECHVKLYFTNRIQVLALAESVPVYYGGCDCWDSHDIAHVTEDTCGCACHRLDTPDRPVIASGDRGDDV